MGINEHRLIHKVYEDFLKEISNRIYECNVSLIHEVFLRNQIFETANYALYSWVNQQYKYFSEANKAV